MSDPATDDADHQQTDGAKPQQTDGAEDQQTIGEVDQEEVPADQGAAYQWGKDGYVVTNQLPRRIRVRGDRDHMLILAPLGHVEVNAVGLAPFDGEKMVRGGELVIEERSRTEQDPSGLVGFAPLVIGVYLYLGFQLDSPVFWFGIPAAMGVVALIWRQKDKKGWTEVQRWMKGALSLALIALLAVGVPAAMIWYMADLDNIAQAPDSAINALTSSHLFLGRALQLLFIAVVSLLPALMYFVFDRERLGTLRARFVQQVFRLDPSLQRRTDLDSKFGEQIDEAYGPPRTGRGRLLGGRLSPIIVATVLITVGWTLTLLNTDVVPNAAGEFSVFDLFRPDTTMLAFAFLGAYFFAIQLVLRSYLRGDLRPKSYGNITVRIIIVVILGWVLQALAGESDPAWLLGAVFIAGIVPETALRWIREYVRGKGPDWAKLDDEKITEADPLTRLEGIDIYDLTRLTEEGVTNVEGLAHHELVDLMLKTRIPAPRLVDWVDQAILYLHVHGKEEGEGIPPDPLPTQLRSFGIRTATDLQNACNARPPDERDKFLGILGGDGARPYRVQVILDALADDEWLAQIKHWRKPLDPDDIIEIDAQHDTSPPRVGVTVLGPGVESGQADSTVVVGEAPAETVAAGNGSSGEIGTAGVEAG